MGCDGGTIPRRDELVRTKKKPEQKDKNSEMAFKWKHCAISQEALVKPIVACELGRLYNKETVLEFLLDRSKFEQASGFDHIKGLKDVKELNLTDNPARRPKDAEKGDSFIDPSISDFICPVVGLEMSGQYRFCFIWTCGCVVSEKAYREIKCDSCQKCGKSYKPDDMIILNGTEDEVLDLYRRMIERRAMARALKKSKKASKHKATDSDEAGPFKKPLLDAPSTSASSSSSSSSHTSATHHKDTDVQVNGHGEGKSKSSLNGKGAVGAKVSKLGGKPSSSSADKISTNGKSGKTVGIQNDPRNSKTFKSLFTTSEAEKLQDKPHWITYNPMYY